MTALRPTGDSDNRYHELRVIDQFAQGLHDRLVRSDVKKFVARYRTSNVLSSLDVLEAASDAAKDHAVEENYTRTYRESATFLSKRVEEKESKVSVANVNHKLMLEKKTTEQQGQDREKITTEQVTRGTVNERP